MQVRFIGALGSDGLPDPKENNACLVFGLEFPRGEWRPVEGPVAAKLKGNPAFEVDTDNDGQAGPTADEMRAELDALNIPYHHNAGPAKLAALLAEAKAKEV